MVGFDCVQAGGGIEGYGAAGRAARMEDRAQLRTIRLGIRQFFLIAGGFVLLTGILIAPFALHTRRFIQRLEEAQRSWREAGVISYRMEVASNDWEGCTGGENVIFVEQGEVVQGENNERGHCPMSEFQELTVEALFTEIRSQCIEARSLRYPFPMCDISYDAEFGYPERLAIFWWDRSAPRPPNLHVESFEVLP